MEPTGMDGGRQESALATRRFSLPPLYLSVFGQLSLGRHDDRAALFDAALIGGAGSHPVLVPLQIWKVAIP